MEDNSRDAYPLERSESEIEEVEFADECEDDLSDDESETW